MKEVLRPLTSVLIRLLILRLLERETMYPYQILTRVRQVLKDHVTLSTFYTVLYELEKRGYVERFCINSSGRKYYRITDRGKQLLKELRNSVESKLRLLEQLIYDTLHHNTGSTQ